VEISSRRNPRERRIDELLARMHEGDVLLVAELSRLGRIYDRT
jgi:DNA invertase Pin-like site-specific DNA recombinase